MPYDPAGRFSMPSSTWAQPGTTIRVEQHNPPFREVEQALSSVLVRDGRAGMVGPLDMGSFPMRNLAAGQSPSDGANVGQLLPIGSVIDFAGTNAPAGWLLCAGQAISRSTYAALFSVIGTAFGNGNGSTTFNVPDLRGRVVAGLDVMGGSANANRLTTMPSTTRGQVGGSAEHTLTIAQMPSHNHSGSTGAGGSHSHTYSRPIAGTGSGWSFGSPDVVIGTASTSTAPNHDHAISSQGSGQAHPNVQPTMVLSKIIKATH